MWWLLSTILLLTRFCRLKKRRLNNPVFFAAFLVLGLALPAQAQSFRGSVSAGLVTSQVSGDNLAGFNKPGAFAGISAWRPIREKLRWELQMAYFEKGSFDPARPDKGDFLSYRLNLRYVEVPVLISYYYKKIWWFTGLSAGYLFSSRIRNQDGDYPENSLEARPFRSYELSYNAGLRFPLGERFELEGRLNQSILPIRPHVGNVVFRLNLGQYNTALVFALRYNLGKN
jgi:hypothetical protein